MNLAVNSEPNACSLEPSGTLSYSGRVTFDPTESTDVHPNSPQLLLQLLLAVRLTPS